MARCGGSSTLWTLVTRHWFKSSEYKFDGAIHKISFISPLSTQIHHEIISSKEDFSFNFVLDSNVINKQEERGMFPLASPRDYFICNPFTRQCVSLPVPRPVYGCSGLSGFVFESSTGTYKVIHIPYYYSKSGNFSLHIFSSDTSEWSTREVTCSHQAETRIHSCVQIVNHSGTWYWIDGEGNYIIAYNDNHNNGRLLNFPEGRSRVGFWQQCLGESKGLLCYGQIENAWRVSTISVWMFQDGYSNGSTWLSVCKDTEIGDFRCVFRCVSSRPRYNFVAFSPVDQDVVIIEFQSVAHAHEVIAYNIKTRQFQVLHCSHHALVASGCYYKSDRRIVVPLWSTIIPSTRN